jgi:hypothetical protein
MKPSLVAGVFLSIVMITSLWVAVFHLEKKVAALERVDKVTEETVAEMLDLIEMMIRTKKSPAGYQAIARNGTHDNPPVCVILENGQERYVSCDEAWLIRKDAEPPCLAQMEAAMRAVDPYIVRMQQYMSPDTLASIRALWLKTKDDCWRQPS